MIPSNPSVSNKPSSQPPPYGATGSHVQPNNYQAPPIRYDVYPYQAYYNYNEPPPAPPKYYDYPRYPTEPQPSLGVIEVEEGRLQTMIAFTDKTIRAAFIRKVYALLSLMLLIVLGMVLLFYFQEDAKRYIQTNQWPYWLSYAVFLVTYLSIACCESLRRNFPGNIICLLLLTVSMGYMTAMITAYYNVETVAIAGGICVICCFSIMLFSCQTKYDFTSSCIGIVFVGSMVLLMFGMFAIIYSIFWNGRILYIVYAGLAAFLFMIYLAIDTQLIIGGKRAAISPEEYILGAVQLFMDIIMIFWYLLQIVGYANENR